MDKIIWLSVLPPLLTIAVAIWTKKIIPSLLVELIAGSYFLNPTVKETLQNPLRCVLDVSPA